MARRERVRENTKQEIKAIAREHMGMYGTAGISLSAIARDMGVTYQALYRYYENRDDLITALIVDSYTDQAIAMENASAQKPEHAYRDRMLDVVIAYRQWALDHPVDFQLIYGNPIPGYVAPAEVTTPKAWRGFRVVIEILHNAYKSGALSLVLPEYEDAVQFHLPAAEEQVSPQVVYAGVTGWTTVHGLVSLELGHQLAMVLGDHDVFYRGQMNRMLDSFGLVNGKEQS
jgi:AcrR family transcriptional regulator